MKNEPVSIRMLIMPLMTPMPMKALRHPFSAVESSERSGVFDSVFARDAIL